MFLYVLWKFPKFLKHVKAEGADPTVVVRLTTFYQLNVCFILKYTSIGWTNRHKQLARVVFRFLFTVPLLIVAVDGLVGTKHRINRSVYVIYVLLTIQIAYEGIAASGLVGLMQPQAAECRWANRLLQIFYS